MYNAIHAKGMQVVVHALQSCSACMRSGCTRRRALKITQNNRLLFWMDKTVVPKTIFLLCYGTAVHSFLQYFLFYIA